MKVIIDGRLYNTDTAITIGSVANGNVGDDDFWEETLYQSIRKGVFFVVSFGAKHEGGMDAWTLSEFDAASWCLEHGVPINLDGGGGSEYA